MHRRIRKLLYKGILIISVFLLTFFIFRLKYRDALAELARTQVTNATSDLINDAIDSQMLNNNIQYDRIVYFEKDLEGRITALKTNMSEVNRLKTAILNLINDEILAMDTSELGIPIGNFLFPEIFSGKGPSIPIRILSIRNSDASFHSAFSEAGINQTLQKLNMDIQVDVSVLVLGQINSFTVSSQVVVAETIIVGQVPEMFFHNGGTYEP